jgi:hypothetical protein
VVFFAIAIYVLLVVFFVVDVLRQQSLSGAGKAAWIAAVVFVPVLAWLAYGFWRIRRSGGLPSV